MSRPLHALFPAAIALSAALLFWVEPLVGKLLLPLLGGTPGVWNTCLVFFQLVLLAGYLWAHVLARFPAKTQVAVQVALALVAFAVLPIDLKSAGVPPGASSPIPWVLAALGAGIGLPFFVLSATSPLLQRWFAQATGREPYPLYVASNVGSLAALLAFPLALEPSLRLGSQAALWTGAYGLAVAAVAWCGVAFARSKPAESRENSDDAPIAWGRRAWWVVLGAVPSSLLLGVTTYVSTDIAAIPLLWVIPLALYLLTFILAFAERAQRLVAGVSKVAIPFVALELLLIALNRDQPAWAVITLHVVTFFVVALTCHGAVARDRPPAARLTEFYLCLSLGGVVGSSFNALLAPVVFHSVAEYPLALLAACLVVPGRTGSRRARFAGLAVAALAAVLLWMRPADVEEIYAARSFFAVSRVTIEDDGTTTNLWHGRINHGMQWRSPDLEKRLEPLLYFHRAGPVGTVLGVDAPPRRLAIVGLGAGAIAGYARPGDSVTYFELDPVVARIAEDSRLFTFLSEAKAKPSVVLGDARLTLAADAGTYDLIILDAFSSDSIPVHLLTTDALTKVYLPHLAPGGRLLMNISNLYFRLDHMAGALAQATGLEARVFIDTDRDDEHGKAPSSWAVMARNAADLPQDPRWKPAPIDPTVRAWTDDWSNPLQALEWRRLNAR